MEHLSEPCNLLCATGIVLITHIRQIHPVQNQAAA